MNGIIENAIIINPTARYDALDWIIDKAVIASVVITNPTILILKLLVFKIKFRTKGIFSAIENAAIFLLAVTPSKFPELIIPDVLIISIAWLKIAYISIPNIIVRIVEKKVGLFLIGINKILMFMNMKNTLNCLEAFTNTSVGFME